MIVDVGDECTGCTACYAACPVGCIQMTENADGFMRPCVDESACIRCGRCRQVCPALSFPREPTVRRSVCGWHRDPMLRAGSSSGGAFAAVAGEVLNRGGIVFGAFFDPGTRSVRHASTDEVALQALMRSKYVQSDVGRSFKAVQDALDSDREVFFCGTPCQVNGLNHFLARHPKRGRLTTADFSCHGVPSRAVFADFIGELESAHQSPVAEINFRSKVNGWKRSTIVASFQNGREWRIPNGQSTYYRGFLDNLYLAPCCYACEHNAMHSSDVIFADFWGWRRFDESLADDDLGLSLVLSNSERGDRILDELGSVFECREVPLEFSRYCLGGLGKGRLKYRPRYDKYFRDYHMRGCAAANRKHIKTGRFAMFVRKVARVWRTGVYAFMARKLKGLLATKR